MGGALLHHGDLHAELCRANGGDIAARPCADDDEVVSHDNPARCYQPLILKKPGFTRHCCAPSCRLLMMICTYESTYGRTPTWFTARARSTLGERACRHLALPFSKLPDTVCHSEP